MVLELGSGKLTYVSDKTQNHDGDTDTDGDGNVVTLAITANDAVWTSRAATAKRTANLNIRINVAPTGHRHGASQRCGCRCVMAVLSLTREDCECRRFTVNLIGGATQTVDRGRV